MRELLVNSRARSSRRGNLSFRLDKQPTTPTEDPTESSTSSTANHDESHPIVEAKRSSSRGLTSRPACTRFESFRLSNSLTNAPSHRTITNWMSGTLETNDLPDNLKDAAIATLKAYATVELSKPDICMAMQTWNKALAFRTSFSEALLLHWRLLMAAEGGTTVLSNAEAYRQVERNDDMLARLFGTRLHQAEELIMNLLDSAIRSVCPHQQTVLREAYRPLSDDAHLTKLRNQDPGEIFHIDCESLSDHTELFARLGIPPDAWVKFTRACAWTFATHVPYAQEDDMADLETGVESAMLRTIVQKAAIPCIEAWGKLAELANDPIVSIVLPRFWEKFGKTERDKLGESIYRDLFTEHPMLTDYFAKTDMDSLSVHLMQALKVIIRSAGDLTADSGPFRSLMKHLGNVHLTLGVPSYAYPLVGKSIIDTLMPYMIQEEQITANGAYPAKATDLKAIFIRLYSEVMSLVYYPMIAHEKTLKLAKEFYDKVAVELKWNVFQLETRLIQIEQELVATGTYTQTAEEIEIGARLAWRNSSKCIGRISWNTLKVIDKRHVTDPEGMFREVEAHMKIATAGTNIQSTMTVFRPLGPNESIGPRFWTDQIVRYACYRDEMTGDVIGDPANAEITEYLISEKLWTPPAKKTPFDVLPMVLKMPGRDIPYVRKLADDCLFEVNLEHPKYPSFKDLGLRWTTVPAISTFKMNLGGIVYANMPFNGWFVSTEIVRNLMERYDVGGRVAQICGIDTQSDVMWRQAASIEVERAVLYSFKKNGFTIVDPHSVGESYCVHVQREREQHGLECPGQWSWIGGLVGPTNKTWHLEMRDFLVLPQYEYCVDGLAYYRSLEYSRMKEASSSKSQLSSMTLDESDGEIGNVAVPRVLIVYGSETGTAEGVARQLKRVLTQLKPTVMTLNQAKGLDITKQKGITHLLCITSTFGKGEFPANAREFIKAPIGNVPAGMKFAVLALGSTLYPDFCKAGVDLDTALDKTGIERLTRFITKADESAGAEKVIAEWIQLVERLILSPSVARELELRALKDPDQRCETVFSWLDPEVKVEMSKGKGSLCLSNKVLTGPGTKAVHQVTFQTPKGTSYETGDHLSVQPVNSAELVGRFLACFHSQIEDDFASDKAIDVVIDQPFELENIEGNDRSPADVVFPMPTTLRMALTEHLDLSMKGSFAVEFVSLCSELCSEMMDDKEAAAFVEEMSPYLVHKGDIDEFISYFPTIVDFFEKYKWLTGQVSLAEVLMLLPRLQPRYYSISSSAVHQSSLSVTVGVLTTRTMKKAVLKGVCSHYLAGLTPMLDRAKIEIRPSTFRLPNQFSSSIVLVGAGTGLAPMMGFLEELEIARDQEISTGNIHLFFGCRTEADFLYKDLINEYEANGLLTSHIAYSRSTDHSKMHVQDQIVKAAKEFKDLMLDPTTHYYVCGDACMAAECQEAAITTLRSNGMSRIAAVQHIKTMKLENRWQTDVWGIVSDYEKSKKTVEISKKASARVWLNHFKKAED